MRRSLPLEPDEEVTKDFYINAGPEAGFKKGVYISVVRAVPVHDPIKNMQQATLNIPVGKLKVIDVQRGITVARLESELSDDERPTLEFEGVMVGDRIDTSSISTEQPKKPKPKLKKRLAQASDDDEPAPGSAEAMAARHVSNSPMAAPSTPAPAAQATLETSAQAAAPAPVADTSKPVEMTTAVDVKQDAPAASSTNSSSAPRAPSETSPKKSQDPKSAENQDESEDRNSYPLKASAGRVRVADYTGYTDDIDFTSGR